MSELLSSYKVSSTVSIVELINVNITQSEGLINITYSTNQTLTGDDFALKYIKLYGSDQSGFTLSDDNLLEEYNQETSDLQNSISYTYNQDAGPYQYITLVPYDAIGEGVPYSSFVVLTKSSQINVFSLDEAKDLNQDWISGKFTYEHEEPPNITYSLNYHGDPEEYARYNIFGDILLEQNRLDFLSAQVSGTASTEGVVFYLSNIPQAYGYKLHVHSDNNVPIYIVD